MPVATDPAAAVARCVEVVLAEMGQGVPNETFESLPDHWMPWYLGALEQALAVGLASLSTSGTSFLQSERAILDGLLRLAVDLPASLRVRMLLLSAMERESRQRPDIVREYRDKLLALQADHPVGDEAAAALVAGAVERLTTGPTIQ